jgi:hypothetical protein
MFKANETLVHFSKSCLLDFMERALRTFLPLAAIIFFVNYINLQGISIHGSILNLSIETIFIMFIVWVFTVTLLKSQLINGNKKYGEKFKNLSLRIFGMKISYSPCVSLVSAILKFTGVLFLAAFIGEYIILVTIIFVTIFYFTNFLIFPTIPRYIYSLRLGQSQLSFLILVLILLILINFLVHPLFTLNTLIILYALRFSLLYFVRVIALLSMAARKSIFQK